jgi:hypothetical protein
MFSKCLFTLYSSKLHLCPQYQIYLLWQTSSMPPIPDIFTLANFIYAPNTRYIYSGKLHLCPQYQIYLLWQTSSMPPIPNHRYRVISMLLPLLHISFMFLSIHIFYANSIISSLFFADPNSIISSLFFADLVPSTRRI